jgi:hypothetical protein
MKILNALIRPFTSTVNPQKTNTIAPSARMIKVTERDHDRLLLMVEQVKNARMEIDLEILKIRLDTLPRR